MPLNYEPFEVTNVHATTKNDYSITLPWFSEFNEDGDITFYVYHFHEYFDGLLGLDLLEKLESTINLKDRKLVTRNAEIPIKMYDSRNVNLFEDIIPAHSSKLFALPINSQDGDVLIPSQTICNCIISDCITRVKNKKGYVEITNDSPNDIVFSLDKPISAELYNFECEQTNVSSNRAKEVFSRLRIGHLNPEEAANLKALCAKYADVFYLEGEPLTFNNKIKHKIKTSDEIPVHTKSYRYPYVHRQEIRDQISKMLEQNIIRPSDSAWSSPIWVVPKKADASGRRKWRLVVDFRKVNEKTIDDKYPIPNITDVLDKLGKCHYFTTLDLASGFYQVEMDPADIHKTAFNVENGHYEFLRMPMGLKNAPSTFQRVMDNVLKDLQNKVCLVYLDDIICFSTSLQEHIVNLEKIFQRLRESNFKIQMDKSEFLKLETEFLGHIISKDGVKPNPNKIAAISKYPLPKTTTQIKRFLGLLGYYRKFIPDFARLTKPLTQCLKKNSKIIIDDEYIRCFEHCKQLLTNDPILQYPDFTKEFLLTTDASNVAVGAVLSQGPVGSDKPIAYASRTLNSSELNYSTIEKELLAIVWATKYFRPYLFGRKFKIITDHKPLQWVMSLKEPNSRLTRWRLKLSEFDFTVLYKQGKSNTNADALSRIEVHVEELSSVAVNLSDGAPSLDDSGTLSAPEAEDGSRTATVHTDDESPILEIPITEHPLNKFTRQIVFNVVGDIKTKPVTTNPFENHKRTTVQLSESNLEIDVINAIKEFVQPKIKTGLLINPPLAMYKIIPIIQKTFKNSSMILNLAKTEVENVREYLRQQQIIDKYHDGKTNHRGINECFLALSRKFYWPKMREHISKFINDCEVCGQAKYDRNPIRQQFQVVPPPSKPFELVHLDLLSVESCKFLTIVDSFSKYAQAYFLGDSTAVSVVQALLKFSTHHGNPLTVVTDNGPEFNNQVISEFFNLHKIQHHKVAPHTPNENGIVERFHLTLLEHLRIFRISQKNESVRNLIPYALLAYNSSIHSFTKCRPIEIVTGHFDPRDPLDIDLTTHVLQQYIQDHKNRMKITYNLIHESCSSLRRDLTNSRNRTREPEANYSPEQQVFVRNPVASRQKAAPRYTQDVVVANLPIHIYTRKKRGPIAKSRLKRVPNTAQLLQDPPYNQSTSAASGNAGDPT